MPALSTRAMEPELMDDLEIRGPDLEQALNELDSINCLLGGNYVTLKAIEQILDAASSKSEYHIADLGCGSGDMMRRIRRYLDRRKVHAKLTGFDANPNVIEFAIAHTPERCRITYNSLNIFSPAFAAHKFDIITATLFFHHFTDAELIVFFKNLRRQVSTAMVINDVHRHWFAFYSIKWLTKLLSRSAMVKHDAPVSVGRAFTRSELKGILQQAGFSNYSIRWCWAFRWQVIAWF